MCILYYIIYVYIYLSLSVSVCLSKKGGFGQFADLKAALAKKGVGVFEGGWYPNTRYGKLNHRLTSFFLGVNCRR